MYVASRRKIYFKRGRRQPLEMRIYNTVTWVYENDNKRYFIFFFFRKWVPFPRPYHGKESVKECFLSSDVSAC